MKVFINPGHMPDVEPGACGNGMEEAVQTLKMGKMLEKFLVNAGIEVVLLQSDNLAGESPDYPNIVRTANESGADLFVSIHCNAATGDARGTETLVFDINSDAAKLAKCINDQIVTTMQAKDPKFPDRGVKEDVRGLAVLRLTDMPAVLVETAFIDNEDDAKLLANYAEDFAACIARGVTDYATAA